ncbi:MAG: ABC transporter ATP-binding protein [Alphaproteobacteria bacterium]|nr:ABC transporter ATP-binding protein [Alphaproteobacteria bacterium]
MTEALLRVSDLAVSFQALHGRLTVLEDVSFDIGHGEVLGVVGESGSGKSVTALSIMGLLGAQGSIDRGAIHFAGRNLVELDEPTMLDIRGREVAMIFQEPMTSLNPVYTVGFQIAEVLIEHLGLSRGAARGRAIELMRRIGIPAAEQRVDQYPHQMSGGMRQRIMIAMAMACEPKLLIADEPTTALDVTIQAQILDLMRDLRRAFSAAILMITHDMGVIASIADRVVVMYAGQIVEEAPVKDLFGRPFHPYTRLLLRSIPLANRKQARLEAIPGSTPSPASFPSGCRFHPRCPDAIDRCRQAMPSIESEGTSRRVRCWRAFEPDLKSARPT